MTSQKPKKKPVELTTDEAMAELFPKEVIERARHEAHEAERVREPKRKVTK